jgi:hypothetical protein
MTTITINDRSFVLDEIRVVKSQRVASDNDEEKMYMEYWFTEDGKTHFVRQETYLEGDSCKIKQDSEAEWFVKE